MTDFRYTLSTSSLVALYFMAMLVHSKVLAGCIYVRFCGSNEPGKCKKKYSTILIKI